MTAVNQRLLTTKFKQTWPELGVVTRQVVVEPKAVVEVGDCPDVVGIKVVALGIESGKHALQRTLAAVHARCTHTHVPHSNVREEVVGNLGLSVEVEDSLMLVTNLMRRTPSRAGLIGNDTNDATHCVVVVVTYTPATAHITTAGTHTTGVMVEVFAVINTLAELEIGFCITINRCAAVVVDFGRCTLACPTGIESIHLLYCRCAHNTHTCKLGVCDAIPSLHHNVDLTVGGAQSHTGIVCIAEIAETIAATAIAVGS